jgi:hypothetical protein
VARSRAVKRTSIRTLSRAFLTGFVIGLTVVVLVLLYYTFSAGAKDLIPL